MTMRLAGEFRNCSCIGCGALGVRSIRELLLSLVYWDLISNISVLVYLFGEEMDFV
jgi:hypothetical protein